MTTLNISKNIKDTENVLDDSCVTGSIFRSACKSWLLDNSHRTPDEMKRHGLMITK